MLTIKDSHGHPVFIASRQAPEPIVNGKHYPKPRQISLGGIVLYDSSGNETGGIGILNDSASRETLIDFDYKIHDAIAMYAMDGGAQFESGLTINDKDYHATDPTKVHPIQRIAISDNDKNASIILRDPEGRDRIVLSVDSSGAAKIEMKDSSGKILR